MIKVIRLIYSALLFFIAFFFVATQTHGQSVYQDALRLADAIQNQDIHVIMTMDSNTFVKVWSCNDNAVNATEIQGPEDGLMLGIGDCWHIKPSGEGTRFIFTIVHRNDTLYQESFTGEIEVSNFAEEVGLRIKKGKKELYIPKKDFTTYYSILGAYSTETNRTLPDKVSDFNRYRRSFADNPFMGPILNLRQPPISDQPGIDSLLDSVTTHIEKLYKSPGISSLQLLRNDSIFSEQYLLSIQDIRNNYRTPALDNIEALQALSSNILAQPDRSGAGDFTSTVLAGLSDFIVERAQEEFNISFMEQFKERLDSVPELAVLFPATTDYITSIDVTNYKSVLTSAREFFIDDMNTLGFHLPNLLNLPKYKKIADRPEVYNIITLYSMVDLAMRGVSIDSLLPYAYGKLIDREQELGKAINLEIGRTLPDSTAYKILAQKTDDLTDNLEKIYKAILRKQGNFYNEFPILLLGASQSEQVALRELFFQAKTGLAQWRSRYKQENDTITVIPNYLRGEYNYAYLLDHANINQFDRYFDHQPDVIQLRGAGVELTRRLSAQGASQNSKAEVLRSWYDALSDYQIQLDSLSEAIEADSSGWLPKALVSMDSTRSKLRRRILNDIPYWDNAGMTRHDSVAFLYLATVLNNFHAIDLRAADDLTKLSERRALLQETRDRAISLLSRLRETYNPAGLSPLEKFFLPPPEQLRAPDPVRAQLDKALRLSFEIRNQLSAIDKTYFDTLRRSRENALLFSNVLDLSFRLLSCFIVQDTAQKWLKGEQFNSLIGDPLTRNVFMGLVFQRLQEARLAPQLSPQGLATLTTGFVTSIGSVGIQMDTIAAKRERREQLRFKDYFPFVANIVNLINQVLQTPIFLRDNPNGIKEQRALIDLDSFSRLQYIPALSDHLIGLLDNVSKEEYRFAISDLVGLYEYLTLILDRDCSKLTKEECARQRRLRHNLLTYGNFIADVAGAREPEDISLALRNVTLPPGSSRIKRIAPADVSINGYFGGLFGHEALKGESGGLFPINTYGLSIPIGITFSFKPQINKRYSISFFASILDLGALTAYRIGTNYEALPKLTFSNVLAPGAFCFYNFGKSPFYVGAGWQFGPQAREYEANGITIEQSATRAVLTFGIDVPLFNLYQAEGR